MAERRHEWHVCPDEGAEPLHVTVDDDQPGAYWCNADFGELVSEVDRLARQDKMLRDIIREKGAAVGQSKPDQDELVAIECAVGGAYEMPDGRCFWVDSPVACEIARRVGAALNRRPDPPVSARERRLASAMECLWKEASKGKPSPGLLLSMAGVIGEASAVLAASPEPAKATRTIDIKTIGTRIGLALRDQP